MSRTASAPTAPRIVLGVTVADSWILLSGFPEKLVAAGWDVHLVSNPGPRLDAYAEVPGIAIHGIPMAREISPGQDLRSLRAWMRLMRTLKPTVVSVGTPKAGLLGILAALSVPRAQRIYVLRGLRLETVHGIKRKLLYFIEKLTMRCSTQVISVSNSLMNLAISLKLVAPNKIQVLGPGSSNGVDISVFDTNNFAPEDLEKLRFQLGLTPHVPVVGFVGRLTADKGLQSLIDAAIELHQQGIAFQLLFVGEAEQDLYELFGSSTEKYPGLILTGRVQQAAPYYQLMDILILPTLREGFPNVVLEAQASGIPVITTTATGAIDSVKDGVTGTLVDPGNTQQLALTLEKFFLGLSTFDPSSCIEWAENFNRDFVQELHLSFYKQILQSKSE